MLLRRNPPSSGTETERGSQTFHSGPHRQRLVSMGLCLIPYEQGLQRRPETSVRHTARWLEPPKRHETTKSATTKDRTTSFAVTRDVVSGEGSRTVFAF